MKESTGGFIVGDIFRQYIKNVRTVIFCLLRNSTENDAEFTGCGKLLILFTQFYCNTSAGPTNNKLFWYGLTVLSRLL